MIGHARVEAVARLIGRRSRALRWTPACASSFALGRERAGRRVDRSACLPQRDAETCSRAPPPETSTVSVLAARRRLGLRRPKVGVPQTRRLSSLVCSGPLIASPVANWISGAALAGALRAVLVRAVALLRVALGGVGLRLRVAVLVVGEVDEVQEAVAPERGDDRARAGGRVGADAARDADLERARVVVHERLLLLGVARGAVRVPGAVVLGRQQLDRVLVVAPGILRQRVGRAAVRRWLTGFVLGRVRGGARVALGPVVRVLLQAVEVVVSPASAAA